MILLDSCECFGRRDVGVHFWLSQSGGIGNKLIKIKSED